MIVASDTQALFAETAYAQQASALAVVSQELATGSALANPAQDPAASTITTLMAGELGGLTAAQANIAQGVDLLNTAAGGVSQAVAIAQQLESLAIQASNGTESSGDRSDLQQQVTALLDQLQTLSTSVQYNGIAVLNGGSTPWSSPILTSLSGLSGVAPGDYSLSLTMDGSSVVMVVTNAEGQTVFQATTANPENALAGTSESYVLQGGTDTLSPGWTEIGSVYDYMAPNSTSPPDPGYGWVINYADGSNGTPTVAGGWANAVPGSATIPSAIVEDTFTLGQTETVYYAIPSGAFVNNGTVAIDVNGQQAATIFQSAAVIASTSSNEIIWQDTLGPGAYTIAFSAPSTNPATQGFNLYGLWFGTQVPPTSVTFVDPTAAGGWASVVTTGINFDRLTASPNDTATFQLHVTGTGGLVLQTGTANRSPDQLGLALPQVTLTALGLSSLSVLTPADAQAAIGTIQAALTELTTGQGTLGAQLNALQDRARGTATMLRTLQASESTLNSADMGQVASAFAHDRVLASTSLGAITHANQLSRVLLQTLGL